jgi:opacity protein-like surface antigen
MDVVRAGLSYKFDPDRFASYAPATSGGGLLYKAPAPAVAAWSWSGFYVGAHAGYGWARDPFDNLFFLDVVKLSGVDSRGFVGGFQTGANWQSGRVVGGLELDLSGTDIKDRHRIQSPSLASSPRRRRATSSIGLVRRAPGSVTSPPRACCSMPPAGLDGRAWSWTTKPP